MINLPVYIIIVSHNRINGLNKVLSQVDKQINLNFYSKNIIVIENNISNEQNLYKIKNWKLFYKNIEQRNKSFGLNYGIKNYVSEQEALLIFLDDDVLIPENYLANIYNCAINKGEKYFFGTSFNVTNYDKIERDIMEFYPSSFMGKSDQAFLSMKKMIFLGFSFACFKSQWTNVGGFDERFGPGSKFNIGGQESVFQKKMFKQRYLPFLVNNTMVTHTVSEERYSFRYLLKRQRSNGKSHGLQHLFHINKGFGLFYFKKILFLFRRAIINYKNKRVFRLKVNYALGYTQAFLIYFLTRNKEKLNFE